MIPVGDEAWTTDRTFTATEAKVDYELHILDDNSTGSYTVYYRSTDTTPPTVASLQAVANPQAGPIDSIGVTFSKPIDASSFDWKALALQLNGGNNLITSTVTVSQTSPTTFTISGLSEFTGSDGNYVLTVNAAGISDLAGNMGAGSLSESWAKGTSAPVVVSVGADSPAHAILPSAPWMLF